MINIVLLADGFEEIEAITVIDVLRRADVPVQTVTINNSRAVKGAHEITIQADIFISDIDASVINYIILPGGGKGVENLYRDNRVKSLLLGHEGKNTAAICAAPSILAKWGYLKGLKATSYPSFYFVLLDGEAEYVEDMVVQDKNLITSRGPATAIDFALAIVQKIKGEKVAEDISQKMLVS